MFIKSKNALLKKRKVLSSQGRNQRPNRTAIKTDTKNQEYSRFNESGRRKETYKNLIEIANKIETSYLTEKDDRIEDNRRRCNFVIDSPQSHNFNNIILEETCSERIGHHEARLPANSIKKVKKARPQSCKRPEDKFIRNRNNRKNNQMLMQNSHAAFNYISAESRNGMEPIRTSYSTAQYGHLNKSGHIKSKERRESNSNSQEKKINAIKNKYSAYQSNISNLNDNRFVIPARSKSKKQLKIAKASAKNNKRKLRPISNRTSDQANPAKHGWINELSNLGNLISGKESFDSSNVEQQTQINDLKEIAKNADNLIEILQNIKKSIGPNQPKDDNVGDFYPPPSSRLQNVILIDTDLEEDATTNHIDHYDNEEIKSDNINVNSELQRNTQEGWW